MRVPAPAYELGRFFELSLDLLCIAGFDGYFKRFNASFERVLGYSTEELMSRPFLEFVHPDDVESARDVLIQMTAGEDVIRFESRLVCADGSVRRFEWNTRTMPQLGVLYGIARDVTERSALAEEQAALRRVATLVARQSAPDDVFAAVTEEMGRLVGAQRTAMLRYNDEEYATLLASWGEIPAPVPVGTRFPLEGDNVTSRVFRTARPARIDHYADATGAIASTSKARGVRSGAGTPIVVEGRVWGVMLAAASDPLRVDTESRLAKFTELVAVAIANAQAHGDLERLADEQAALRRVATLVAQERSAAEVFARVAEEVGRVLGVEDTRIVRYDSDGMLTVVASWGKVAAAIPVGTRWPAKGENISTMVLRTGSPARKDYYDDASGPVGDHLRQAGIRSAVGCPILVNASLWGAMLANCLTADPLPLGSESRISRFTELVATAISNTEARAELAASRGRLVAAGVEERRRVVRDLHDGAQQRLVHTIITLKLARRSRENGDESLDALLTEALDHVQRATEDRGPRRRRGWRSPRRQRSGGAGRQARRARWPAPRRQPAGRRHADRRRDSRRPLGGGFSKRSSLRRWDSN
jgi:PAS domain S-box-containing protein